MVAWCMHSFQPEQLYHRRLEMKGTVPFKAWAAALLQLVLLFTQRTHLQRLAVVAVAKIARDACGAHEYCDRWSFLRSCILGLTLVYCIHDSCYFCP